MITSNRCLFIDFSLRKILIDSLKLITAKDLELSGECGHNNLQSGLKKSIVDMQSDKGSR
jgi:hypothetical protein